MSKLVLIIEISDVEHPWKYRCDCPQLPGTPPVGLGRNVVASVADFMAQHGVYVSGILTENVQGNSMAETIRRCLED